MNSVSAVQPDHMFWPMCARCEKRVEKCSWRSDWESDSIVYEFRCHGNVESLGVSEAMRQQRGGFEEFMRGFRAFAGPTKEEREIAELKSQVEMLQRGVVVDRKPVAGKGLRAIKI